MLLRTRLCLAVGIAFALSTVAPLTQAQAPKSRSGSAKVDSKKGSNPDQDQDQPDVKKAGPDRPDPAKDPVAARRRLRQILGMGRMFGGGRGGPGGPGGPGGRGGPGGPGGGGMTGLLQMSPGLQEEIKLTEKQKTAIKNVSTKMQEQTRQLFQSMRNNNGGGNGGFDRQAMQEAMVELAQQNQMAMDKILNKEQKKRLSQIELQIEGPIAIAEKPEVATKLNLTPSQKQKLAMIIEKMQTEQQELRMSVFGNGPQFGQRNAGGGRGNARGTAKGEAPAKGAATKDDPAVKDANANGGGGGPGGRGRGNPFANMSDEERTAMQERMRKMGDDSAEIEDTAEKKIGGVLNDRQKSAWFKMLGEPVDPTALVQGMENQFGPGGRNGPGGGGNNPRRGQQPGGANGGVDTPATGKGAAPAKTAAKSSRSPS